MIQNDFGLANCDQVPVSVRKKMETSEALTTHHIIRAFLEKPWHAIGADDLAEAKFAVDDVLAI